MKFKSSGITNRSPAYRQSDSCQQMQLYIPTLRPPRRLRVIRVNIDSASNYSRRCSFVKQLCDNWHCAWGQCLGDLSASAIVTALWARWSIVRCLLRLQGISILFERQNLFKGRNVIISFSCYLNSLSLTFWHRLCSWFYWLILPSIGRFSYCLQM